MKVLGIESSCDETAAAVVEDGKRLLSNVVASSMDLHVQYGGVVPEIAARSHIEVINSVIEQALYQAKYGQSAGLSGVQGAAEQRTEPYQKYGEGAAQAATQQSAKNARSKVGFARLEQSMASALWDDIDAIAVTYGAGLGGSLLIGVLTARTLAITHQKPLYAVNHVEGHAYANFLTELGPNPALQDYKLPSAPPAFPALALIVSGGHSQLVLFRDHFDYTLLGQTHDDAIGEAFDKVAKIIGLPYPGGVSIGKLAPSGDAHAYSFPKAKMTHVGPELQELRNREQNSRQKTLIQNNAQKVAKGDIDSTLNSYLISHDSAATHRGSYDFSFSGLKTAVLRTAQDVIGKDFTFPSKDIAALLSPAQQADIAASFDRIATETVVDKTILAYEEFQPRSVIIAGGVAASPELRRQLAERLPIPIEYTDRRLCTDNGAMIATLGCFHMKYGRPTTDPYSLDIAPNLSM